MGTHQDAEADFPPGDDCSSGGPEVKTLSRNLSSGVAVAVIRVLKNEGEGGKIIGRVRHVSGCLHVLILGTLAVRKTRLYGSTLQRNSILEINE